MSLTNVNYRLGHSIFTNQLVDVVFMGAICQHLFAFRRQFQPFDLHILHVDYLKRN